MLPQREVTARPARVSRESPAVNNEPGLGLSLAASLWGIVKQVGKTWHAEPESLARMACSIREETKKPGQGEDHLPLEAVAMLECVVSAVVRRELLGGF